MELKNWHLEIITNNKVAQTKLTGTTYHRELTELMSSLISPSPPIVMSPLTTAEKTQVRNSLCWAVTRGINAAERRKEGLRFMLVLMLMLYCRSIMYNVLLT